MSAFARLHTGITSEWVAYRGVCRVRGHSRTLAQPKGTSPVPVVVIQWCDLRPGPRHHLAVRPPSDDEVEPDLHDQVRDKHVRAPAVTRERCQAADDECRHVEDAHHSPEP